MIRIKIEGEGGLSVKILFLGSCVFRFFEEVENAKFERCCSFVCFLFLKNNIFFKMCKMHKEIHLLRCCYPSSDRARRADYF